MMQRDDAYTIIARLVDAWPADHPSPVVDAARAWLQGRQQADVRTLARDALVALDTLMQAVHGGAALDTLFDARKALAAYVQPVPEQREQRELAVTLPPSGGVTLVREGHHFTIADEDLEAVREAINARKREVRKRQRRATGQVR